ncbi:hypothetical protein HDC92_002620 [Pedobacter sp. AK017]|uniref:hypothetical protein n=1 Tax=Pedobacter sp. AK017 TaxID=2723073 RepID=UPI00161D4EE6|nr:hypothetical protein [Pedobacter sp. AK017]MBB5438936.1 hypothetical protein [Pedobacter sp. AK017]
MKINLRYIILIAAIAITCFSCKKSSEDAEMTLDKNLLKSAEKYAALVEQRTDGEGKFTIENIHRNGDILTLNVKGGCTEEDFQVIWDGVILLSYPGQIKLVLNNDNAGNCAPDTPLSIEVNLRKILGKQDPKDFIFHVANGSVKQNKSLNPDGTVSSN